MEDQSSPCLRCPHCAGPLSKEMETSRWTIAPLIRDSFSMIGSAVGGTASAFYGFNHVMPIVQRRIKGPMWLHFFIGVLSSPLMVFISVKKRRGPLKTGQPLKQPGKSGAFMSWQHFIVDLFVTSALQQYRTCYRMFVKELRLN